MEMAPALDGSMITLVGGFAVVFLGPHLVPILLTTGLIAGALLTGIS